MFLNLAASDILHGMATLLSSLMVNPQPNWMIINICWITHTFTIISRCACCTGIMLLAFDIFASTILFKVSNTTPWFVTMRFVGSVIGINWALLGALGIWVAVEASSVGCNVVALFNTMSGRVAVLSILIQSLFSIVFYTMTFCIASHKIRS